MSTLSPRRGHATDVLPASHADLVDCPPVAALTTLMADGYPQTTVVWCDFDAGCVRVSTMRGFTKERNMRRDPRVTLLCYDPREPLRYLEVRGMVVSMTETGALEHLDALASRYAGRPMRYFGGAIPAHFAETERPVLCRIRPDHVTAVDGRGRPPGRRSTSTPASPATTPASPPITPSPTTTVPIPADHLDLLTRPICGVLTTLGPDGTPESSLVWVDFDGECARVNTTLERRKGRDLTADPRLSLLVVDPGDTGRFIQVRGDAELLTDGALEHLDSLTRTYTTHPAYYGHVYPEDQRTRETRVICRIHPRRVTLDAIHA